MSHETVYRCDRCKKKIQKGTQVHACDFGKDYSSKTPDERILMELCHPCWKAMLRFLGVSQSQERTK